jgi:hypothetical protein
MGRIVFMEDQFSIGSIEFAFTSAPAIFELAHVIHRARNIFLSEFLRKHVALRL